jgi:hypothetical protein
MTRLIILYIQATLLFAAGLFSLYISIFARKEWERLKRTKWLTYLVPFSWFICPWYFAGRIFYELPAGNPIALILTLIGAASLIPSFIVWLFIKQPLPTVGEQKGFTSQYIRQVILATLFMLLSDLFLGCVLVFWGKPYFWIGVFVGVLSSVISTVFFISLVRRHGNAGPAIKAN